MVGVERLDAMGMRTHHRIRTAVDQPPRQVPLAFVHLASVLVAPMNEHQDKRSVRPRFRDRRRDALAIPRGRDRDVIRRFVDVRERDDRGPGSGPRRQEMRGVGARGRLAGAERRDIARLQPRDRIQERLASEISRVVVRQADCADSRRGQDPHRLERGTQRISLPGNGVSLLGQNAFQIYQFRPSAFEPRPNTGQRIRPALDRGPHRPAQHDVAAQKNINIFRGLGRTQKIKTICFPRGDELA